MLKRTITVIVSVAVLIPILFFSGTVLFPIAVALFTLVALFEIFRCTGVHKNLLLTLPLYIAGAVSPFLVRYLGNPLHLSAGALLAIILLILWDMTIIVFGNNKTSLASAASAFFLAFYIIFAFSGIVWLRDLDDGYIYLLIFIGAWVTDTFAYLTGMAFGRHKLIPSISPKKTVEGSVGGTLVATAVFTAVSYFIGIWDLGWALIVVSGLVVSMVSQIGDLSMSAIKRQFGIKDFGNLFPGHGGVLDRFDSILAVSSVMTILFVLINYFGA